MTEAARRIVDSTVFQHFILGVIVVGAIVIGVETSATLTTRYGAIIGAVEVLIQTIFVAEISLARSRRHHDAHHPLRATSRSRLIHAAPACSRAGRGRRRSSATVGTCSTLPSWPRPCCRRPARSPWSPVWRA